jgi:hypothetical protein
MEPRGHERHRWANREVERSFGKSDIEGKAAMGSSERAGKRTSFKWAGAHESKRGSAALLRIIHHKPLTMHERML